MKKILPGIVFVSCISSVFCTDDEKYSFNNKPFNIGQQFKSSTVRELSFTIPSIGHLKYQSSFTEIIKYLGKEGEFHILEATLTEMETKNSVANMEIMDYYWEAMNDVPCHLYIKSNGYIDHIEMTEEKHNYLQEAFEGAYLGMFERNYLHPFGFDAIDKKPGESWTAEVDSSKFYFTMDSPASFAWIKETNKFKKVKKRRRREIAYIERIDTLSLVVNIKLKYSNEERFITGHATGTAEGIWKFDVTDGYVVYIRMASNLQGDFEMDGETFVTRFDRYETHKVLE